MIPKVLPGSSQTTSRASPEPSRGSRVAPSRPEQAARRPQARISRPCAEKVRVFCQEVPYAQGRFMRMLPVSTCITKVTEVESARF